MTKSSCALWLQETVRPCLMLVDKKSRSIRSYDSGRGSVDEAEIGTKAEIENMRQGCVNMAEEVLSKMLTCEWATAEERE